MNDPTRTGFCRNLRLDQGLHVEGQDGPIDITVAGIEGIGSDRIFHLIVQEGYGTERYSLSSKKPDIELRSGVRIGALQVRNPGRRANLSFSIGRTDCYSWIR